MKESKPVVNTPEELEGGVLTEESVLPIRELDLKVAAAELAQGVEETKKLVAGLDEAKMVRQKVLDLQISI